MHLPQRCLLPAQPDMTRRHHRVSVRADATGFGFIMLARIRFAVIAFALGAAAAHAQAPEPSDAAKGMVGAWEISNAARDKTCPLNFQLDAVTGGFKLELDEGVRTAFPSLKEVTVWAMGPNDSVRLFNSNRLLVLDFAEVESQSSEVERNGEGS